jgi:hypothetical protein
LLILFQIKGGSIVIKFLGENVPSAEIHHRLQQQYGEECLSWTRVFEWCKCFREGRECVENELRVGAVQQEK